MLNKVFLIGNLTRDPECYETPSGVSCCRFDLAVSRSYANADGERQTDFFKCTAWRGLGETIARYCKKGNKIAVVGSVQIRDYEDNNGNKRTTVDVIVQDVEFLTPKAEAMEEEQPAPKKKAKKPTLQPMDDDSDIPF